MFFFVCFKVSANKNQIPFIYNNGQITLTATISNSDKNLLFDTGAPCCLFLEDIGDTINYEITRKTFVEDGFGNKKQTWLTKIKAIKLGEIFIKDEYFILVEANPILKSQKIVGIIGFNIINKLDWKFNFLNNEVEIKKRIKVKNCELEYKLIHTFIMDNFLHTTIAIDNDLGLIDSCLIDFGDNMFISIARLYRVKQNYAYINIHSTATAAATQKQDTSFVIVKNKIEFNHKFCMNKFPVFTENNSLQNSIGSRFFSVFDEVIIQNSQSRILLKNKERINISFKKYSCFFNDDVLTSYFLGRNEKPEAGIGDKINTNGNRINETINFSIQFCQ